MSSDRTPCPSCGKPTDECCVGDGCTPPAAPARAGWLVLGRDKYGDADDGPWWPLYLREGPMYAESASAAVALVRERVAESEPQWEEFVAVPFDAWEVEPR